MQATNTSPRGRRAKARQEAAAAAPPKGSFKGPTTLEEEIGLRIKRLRTNLGMTQAELTKQLDYSRAAAAQWERGESLPPLTKFDEMARILKTKREYLTFGIDYTPVEVMPDPDKMGFAIVKEITVGDSATDLHEVMPWALPYQWLRAELQAEDFDHLCVYKVQVDSPDGKFEFGDRVVVDRASTRPSPPGHFLIWDGFGAQIAHVTVVPAGTGKPLAKVVTAAGAYEIDAQKLQVLGRVRGKFTKF